MEDNRCDTHKEKYKDNYIVSPCIAICKICKKKKVHGYTNPDHVCIPFGYLYLFPVLCDNCSEEKNKCKWCYNI